MEIPQGYILIKETDFQELLDTITLLQERVKELEGQKNKDSHNSHIPPKQRHRESKELKGKARQKQGVKGQKAG